ncbi:patatin-like phospholipase family protein [Aquabacterium sp. A08]|uniref:patatin-like phospholipase family protein n=1 Tax=Aquabacterium sp. A08 TaxID=2718532 RepID=UPI0035304932
MLSGLCLGAVWGLAGCAGLGTPGAPADATPVPPQPEPPRLRAPRVGLALGGGAARGFAHIGVIQVLEREGIRPDLVVGTSAGSLVAALYASGMGGAQLEQAALAMEEATIADWTLPIFNRGLLRGEALARYVNRQVQGRLIQDMRLPLGILATELATGRGVLFQRGDTGTAVRASSAVPGVFTPVEIAGKAYVDGGLVAPVPVEQARQMGAELVVAVDISSPPDQAVGGDALRVLLQTFSIMGQSINRQVLAQADVLVRPALAGMGSADFTARQRAMQAGREAMAAALPRLREQWQAKRQPEAPGRGPAGGR